MNYPVIAEFVLEFIKYADENDVRNFLEFLFQGNYVFSTEESKYDSNYFKNKFMELLISHPNNNQVILRHLEALQSCYASYQSLFNDDKERMEIIDTLFAIFTLSKPINPKSITSKDKTKLLHMIIENCVTNGFYYCFFNNLIIKWDVKSKKKNTRTSIEFAETVYKLIDTANGTLIVNEDNYVNYNMRYILPRYDINQDRMLETDENKFLTNVIARYNYAEQQINSDLELVIQTLKKYLT